MIIDELFEAPQQCPECGGISFSDLILAEKKDACYHKVKASAKVWPSAYASGRLVQCRKKGAANYGNKSEGIDEAKPAGSRYMPPLEGPGSGSGYQSPTFTVPIIPNNVPGGANMPMAGRNIARDMATGRNVGGKAIPSLGQPGKVVTSPTMDKILTKLGGKNVEIVPGPTSKSASTNVRIDPAADVPAYIRKGLPDPITTPKPGTKLTVKVRPGETMDQAIQRTKTEQEFSKFLQGQGNQSFGAKSGRGTANPEPAKQQKFTEPKTDKQREWDEFKKEHGFDHVDKIEYDHSKYLDAMAAQVKQKGPPPMPPKKSKWKTPDTDIELEEQSRKKREQPEVDYDAIDHDKSVERLRHLAGLGPMKTVYDPNKRQYRNMPTAVQPKK